MAHALPEGESPDMLPFHLLADRNPDGIVAIDGDGRVCYANLRAAELLQSTVASLVGRVFEYPITPDGTTEIRVETSAAASPSRQTGRARRIEVHAAQCMWRDTVLTVATLRDVTVQRRLQESLVTRDAALQEMTQQLSAVLNALPHAVALLDGSGRIRLVNRQWAQLHAGYVVAGAHVTIGLRYADYCSAATWLSEHLVLANGIGQAVRGECATFHFDYEQRAGVQTQYYSLLVSHIQLDRLGGAVVVHRDVTDDRRADEERRYLASLLEYVSDAVISTAQDYRVRSWNRAATRMYGWEEQDVVGRSIYEIGLDTDYVTGSESDARTALRERGYWQGDLVQHDRYGRPLNIHASVVAIRDAADEFVGAVTVNRDMSEVHKREREVSAIARIASTLRTTETLAGIVDALLTEAPRELRAETVAIAVFDPATGQHLLSDAVGPLGELFSEHVATAAGVSGKVMREQQPFVTANLALVPECAAAAHLPDGIAAGAVPLVSQGQVLGVAWLARTEPLTDGDVAVLEAMADITAAALDRVRLLEQVQRQANILQLTLDSLEDGVVVLDESLRVVTNNPAAQQLLSDHGRFEDGRLIQLGTVMVDVLLQEADQEHGLDILAGPEAETMLSVYAHALAGDSQTLAWMMVMRDVTVERQRQVLLREQERMAAVGQLAAGIAHDFNNVMTAIILYAQMLRRLPSLDQRSLSRIDTILAQAEHAGNLIDQILDFGRRSVIEQRTFDLAEMIRNWIGLWRRTLPETIRVDVNITDEALYVSGDQTRLQQALMNLVLNARDAMEEGGVLAISVEKVSDTELATENPAQGETESEVSDMQQIRVLVRDTGIGIPDELRARIFDPFFTTKPAGRGTGLGLSQVYGIMQQHGGNVTVESAVGGGSTFELTIPLAETPPVVLRETSWRAEDAQGERESQVGTVLLVEDNEATRSSLSEELAERGYEVVAVEDGAAALEALGTAGNTIDCVVTDLVLPGMDGMALCQAVGIRFPTIRCIVMTGYPQHDERAEALRNSGIPWVQKPFVAAQLIELFRGVA